MYLTALRLKALQTSKLKTYGLAKMVKGSPKYFLQNFVDSGGLIGEGMHAPKREDLFAMLEEAKKTLPCAALRGVD